MLRWTVAIFKLKSESHLYSQYFLRHLPKTVTGERASKTLTWMQIPPCVGNAGRH